METIGAQAPVKGGRFRATAHRLRPELLPRYQEAVRRAAEAGLRDVGNAARLEMIERFGPSAYENIELGTISGGGWVDRTIGKHNTERANARIADQFGRAIESGQ
jgi:hypothetical protein